MRFTIEIVDPTCLDLLEAAERSLQRLGKTTLIEKPPKAGHLQPDGFLTITNPPQPATRYVCEAKRQVNAQTLAAAVSRLKDLASQTNLKPLLITEYVNPNLADALRSQDIAYIDGAGNTLLADPPLFIWLRGFKPDAKPNRTARAFQTTGLRLLAFLLKTPDAINWSYRKLADETDLSLGSISRILADLRSLGFITLTGPHRSTLVDRHRLFDQWEFGYVSRLRPGLKPQTFRQADVTPLERLPEQLPPVLREDILIGGELAAALATRHLRPQSATLHVPPHRPLLPLLKELRLIPDPQGNITALQQLASTATWRWEAFASANLVHPILIHAELLQGHIDDRLRETARTIFDQYLNPILNDEPQPATK